MGLTLARRVGETIQIGDDIFVTPVLIREGVVRLDVIAPIHIPITRIELERYASNHPQDRPNNTKQVKASSSSDSVLGLHEQQDKQNLGTTS